LIRCAHLLQSSAGNRGYQAKRENSKAAGVAPQERQRAEALAHRLRPNKKPTCRIRAGRAPCRRRRTGRTGRAGRAERSGSNPGCSGPQIAPRVTSLNAARVADLKNTAQPAALLSAAASGDTTQTAALLNQGAALEAA